jgi:bifunctional DNase/RNase
MKRKQVKVLGLSYSQSQVGSYVLVLSEMKGKVKLPIIIKPQEAQRIALEIEGIKSTKPLTHDLFRNLTDSYGIDLQEVFIYQLAEGVFYTKLITTNQVEEVEIEASVGDAVILSLLYDCPIYVSQEVLNRAGVLINDDGSPLSEDEMENDEEVFEDQEEKTTSIENLERMLEHAVANEEYEIAAKVRDRIEEMKKAETK